MAEVPTYARSWGLTPMKEREDSVTELAASHDTAPRRRSRPATHRGRWAAGAIALSAGAVWASFAFPESVQLLIRL